jgi:Domain of unknown function DUF29
MRNIHDTSDLVGYDEDHHAWMLEQIALLKAERFTDIDIKNLADELRALVNSLQGEIESRLTILLQHLLKWQFQPKSRTNSWRATVLEQRFRINRIIRKSPSLRRYPSLVIAEEYLIARLRASDETGLPLDRLPNECPYSINQVLDEEFWPGTLAG